MKKHLLSLAAALFFFSAISVYTQEKKINVEVTMTDEGGMKIIKTEENGKVTIDTILFDELSHEGDMLKEFKFTTGEDSLMMQKIITIEVTDDGTGEHKMEKVFMVNSDDPQKIHKEFVWTTDDKNADSYDAFKKLAEQDGWKVTEYTREMKNDKEKIVIVREKIK